MQTPNLVPSNGQQFVSRTLQVPRVNWWLRLTSAGWDKPQETIEQREIARRSRLASWILLGILVVLVIFIPASLTTAVAALSVVGAFIGVLIIILFNRKGHITIAGTLLVIVISAATMSVLVGSPDGQIHLIDLPAYDFLVLPVVLGASILPRSSAFIIAFVNIGVIYTDFLLQSKAQDLLNAIDTYHSFALGTLVLTGRPVAILVMTTVITYLWVRGMDQAVQRADREEELRTVEQQFSEAEGRRTEQVEEFVQETINALNALANGQEGIMLLSSDHPWQPQAIFINQQLKQFFKLKQANKGNNDQAVLASELLLRALQRMNNDQAQLSILDPRQFKTPVPLINEIARYLYFMLQGRHVPPAPMQRTSGQLDFGERRF